MTETPQCTNGARSTKGKHVGLNPWYDSTSKWPWGEQTKGSMTARCESTQNTHVGKQSWLSRAALSMNSGCMSLRTSPYNLDYSQKWWKRGVETGLKRVHRNQSLSKVLSPLSPSRRTMGINHLTLTNNLALQCLCKIYEP